MLPVLGFASAQVRVAPVPLRAFDPSRGSSSPLKDQRLAGIQSGKATMKNLIHHARFILSAIGYGIESGISEFRTIMRAEASRDENDELYRPVWHIDPGEDWAEANADGEFDNCYFWRPEHEEPND